jgi:hypothetical protein
MKFRRNEGATQQDFATVHKVDWAQRLPSDYCNFLKESNGGEGFVGNEYLILWKLDELERFNQEYEVGLYLPSVVLFGSNGGGEAYGFDTKAFPWQIVRVPFIGMSPELCKRVARSFSEFFANLEKT